MTQLRTTLTALVAVLAVAGVSKASISGSAHDFGTFAWSGNQICQPCHTPHNASVKDTEGNTLNAPLWNHTLSSTTSYTLFSDPAPGATPVTGEVDQNSKACLSCHDGTVALDSFYGATGTQYITNAKAVFGTNLSNDHPIGAAAIWPTVNPSYMVNPTYRGSSMPLRLMANGTDQAVGCTSCHEPHNRGKGEHLLWYSNIGAGTTVDGRSVSGSVLCMNCHKK